MTARSDIEKQIDRLNRQFREGKLKKREYYKTATTLYQTKAMLDIMDLAEDGFEASKVIQDEVNNLRLKDSINTEAQFNRMRDRFRRDRIKTNARKTVEIDQWRVGPNVGKLEDTVKVSISANVKDETEALAKQLAKKVNAGLDFVDRNGANQDVASTYMATIEGLSQSLGEQVYTGDPIDRTNLKEELANVMDRKIDPSIITDLSDDQLNEYNEDMATVLQIPHMNPRSYRQYRKARASTGFHKLMSNLGVSSDMIDLLQIAIDNSTFWNMLEKQGFDSEQKREYVKRVIVKAKDEQNLNGNDSPYLDDLLVAAINGDFNEFDRILNSLGSTII